jgi:hypothetical protein
MVKKKVREIVIPLKEGWTLRCGVGEEHQWGGYVRVVDWKGSEVGYWTKEEWENDPECVMGAIFVCATDQAGIRCPKCQSRHTQACVDGGRCTSCGTMLCAISAPPKRQAEGRKR